MSIWMIVMFVALASAIAWWWIRYGERVAWKELPRRVGEFSVYAAQGGVLDIRHAKSGRMIQFATLGQKAPNVTTLEFGLPDMEWSGRFFDDLTSRLEAAGFACTVDIAPTEDSPVRRFASVTYSGSPDDLVDRTAELLWMLAGFIDVHPEDQTKIRFRGVIRPSAMQEGRTSVN